MRYFFSLLILLFSLQSQAQIISPIKWNYSAKKISNDIYEIHLTASIQNQWHIYSQFTPDGGPNPTKIIFKKNPLLTQLGKPREKGKLLQKHEEVFDIDVKYFEKKVDFVQKIKVKNNAKTHISGTIEFMACNEQQCLPPTTIGISVQLK